MARSVHDVCVCECVCDCSSMRRARTMPYVGDSVVGLSVVGVAVVGVCVLGAAVLNTPTASPDQPRENGGAGVRGSRLPSRARSVHSHASMHMLIRVRARGVCAASASDGVRRRKRGRAERRRAERRRAQRRRAERRRIRSGRSMRAGSHGPACAAGSRRFDPRRQMIARQCKARGRPSSQPRLCPPRSPALCTTCACGNMSETVARCAVTARCRTSARASSG